MVGYAKSLLTNVYQNATDPTDVYPHTAIGNQDFHEDKIIVRSGVHVTLYASNNVVIKSGAIEVEDGGTLTIKYLNSLIEEDDAITTEGTGKVERIKEIGVECEIPEGGSEEEERFFDMKNTNVTDITNNHSISIYPNPTNSEINLIFNEDVEVRSISVTNSYGQRIVFKQVDLNSSKKNIKIDMEPFERGTYFIEILTIDGSKQFKKIVLN
jgi:hypothetical protein